MVAAGRGGVPSLRHTGTRLRMMAYSLPFDDPGEEGEQSARSVAWKPEIPTPTTRSLGVSPFTVYAKNQPSIGTIQVRNRYEISAGSRQSLIDRCREMRSCRLDRL